MVKRVFICQFTADITVYAKRERTYGTYMKKISVMSRSYVNMSKIAIGSFLKSAGGEPAIADMMGLPPEDRVCKPAE